MKKLIILVLVLSAIFVVAQRRSSLHRIPSPTKIDGWLNVNGDVWPVIPEKWDLGKPANWWDSSFVSYSEFRNILVWSADSTDSTFITPTGISLPNGYFDSLWAGNYIEVGDTANSLGWAWDSTSNKMTLFCMDSGATKLYRASGYFADSIFATFGSIDTVFEEMYVKDDIKIDFKDLGASSYGDTLKFYSVYKSQMIGEENSKGWVDIYCEGGQGDYSGWFKIDGGNYFNNSGLKQGNIWLQSPRIIISAAGEWLNSSQDTPGYMDFYAGMPDSGWIRILTGGVYLGGSAGIGFLLSVGTASSQAYHFGIDSATYTKLLNLPRVNAAFGYFSDSTKTKYGIFEDSIKTALLRATGETFLGDASTDKVKILGDSIIYITGLCSTYWWQTVDSSIIESNKPMRFGEGSIIIANDCVTIGTEVLMNGDLVWGSGGGLSFGEIYVQENTTATDLLITNQWEQFVDFTNNGQSNNCTPDYTSDHILITEAGIYQVMASISFTGGKDDQYELQIYKNDGATALPNLFATRYINNVGEYGSASISGLANFAVNDIAELWVRNITNATDATLKDVNLSIVQIGK